VGNVRPPLRPFDFEKLAVSTVAVGLTAAKYAPASGAPAGLARVSVETNTIRWRADGADPDTTTGNLYTANTTFDLDSPGAIKRFKAIRVSADATIHVTYYRTQPGP